VSIVNVQVMAMAAVVLWYIIVLSGYFICFSSWLEGIHINWLSMPPIITRITGSVERDLRRRHWFNFGTRLWDLNYLEQKCR